MPRVALTPAQREAAKRAAQARAMADRLAVYKNRHSLSNKAIPCGPLAPSSPAGPWIP